MKWLIASALLTFGGTSASAQIVTVTGSGLLATVFGTTYSVGDPFSFSMVYDENMTFLGFDGGSNIYAPIGPFSFTVNGVSYVDTIRNPTYYTGTTSTLSFGGRGDHDPNGGISIQVGRANPFDLSLPTASEIEGKPGQFYFRTGGSGGSGIFLVSASSVPELASWATMLTGLGIVGSVMRHRTKVSRVNYA